MKKIKRYRMVIHEKGKPKNKIGDEFLATDIKGVKDIMKKHYPNFVIDELKRI